VIAELVESDAADRHVTLGAIGFHGLSEGQCHEIPWHWRHVTPCALQNFDQPCGHAFIGLGNKTVCRSHRHAAIPCQSHLDAQG